MNTNTLFNIYQSYTLTKVSELNKQTLVALYAQNEQLNKLNEELARSNRATEQILRNQIKEIEIQEKNRYFKSMTFNLSQAMTLLENEENVNFRIFASNLFLSPIRDLAKNAIQELDEIPDKEYAQNIVKRTQTLSANTDNNIGSYKESPWAHLLPTKSKIDSDISIKIRDKKREIKLKTIKQEELVKRKTKKNQDYEKISKGCFGCLQNMTLLLILAVGGTIYTHDYEATKGAIIMLIPTLLLLAGAYAEKKEKLNKKTDNRTISSNENEKKEDSEEEILEKELEALYDELTNLQQEETKICTQYNEFLQIITADCPKWESKLSEIATYIPHAKR